MNACESVLSNWVASTIHAADPASAGGFTWTDSSCVLDPNGTSIGSDSDARKKGLLDRELFAVCC